jgi:hypothetical protein
VYVRLLCWSIDQYDVGRSMNGPWGLKYDSFWWFCMRDKDYEEQEK